LGRILKICAAICALVSTASHAETPEQSLNFERCFVSEVREALECAVLSTSDDAKLRVVRAPAVKPLPDALPLVVLAGGPGQAASEMAVLIRGALSGVNQTSDILFVDRRATGESKPWQCTLDEDAVRIDDLADDVAECYEAAVWPTDQLTSRQSVEDLEALREALGVNQFNLWGGSWGTRFALLYAQWYPQSIHRMVLDGVAPQARSVVLSGVAAQASLERLQALCLDDVGCAERFPSFSTQLAELITPLNGTRTIVVEDPKTGETVEEEIAHWMIAHTIRGALYQPRYAAQIPYIISEAHQGRWEPFAVLANTSAGMADSMYLGLTFSVMCSEELPRSSDERAAEDGANSFIGTSWYRFWRVSCDAWPVEAVRYPEPTMLSQPSLLISGGLDPVTPPSYAEETARRLSESQHIVFQRGGHINSTQPCMNDVLKAFYRGADLPIESECESADQFPKFQLDRYGPGLSYSLEVISND